MKKTLIVAAALVLFSSVAFGQEVAPNLAAGSRAILFSFDNFIVGTFEMSSEVGAKYYISDNLAARGRLSFFNSNLAIPEGTTLMESSSFSLGISPAIEWHIVSERVSPYLGGGLGFSFRCQSPGEKVTMGFDISALAGAEFFLLEEVSLGGEYRFGFSSTFGSDQVVGSTTIKQGSSNFIGFTTGAGLTLAIYF